MEKSAPGRGWAGGVIAYRHHSSGCTQRTNEKSINYWNVDAASHAKTSNSMCLRPGGLVDFATISFLFGARIPSEKRRNSKINKCEKLVETTVCMCLVRSPDEFPASTVLRAVNAPRPITWRSRIIIELLELCCLPFKEMKMETEANERKEIKRNNFVALGVTKHAIVSRAHTRPTNVAF